MHSYLCVCHIYQLNVLKLIFLFLSWFLFLQLMHFMPPTTCRSFQTSVSKMPWTRRSLVWLCGPVRHAAVPAVSDMDTRDSNVYLVPVRYAQHSSPAAGLRSFYQWHNVQRSNPASHGYPKTGQQECALSAWTSGRHQCPVGPETYWSSPDGFNTM